MMCKFEHDGDCCNCGSPQYMAKCKPSICGCIVPVTNADRIRAMSDEDLAEVIGCPYNIDPDMCLEKNDCLTCCEEWLSKPVEEAADG